jgi:hypothetical protein
VRDEIGARDNAIANLKSELGGVKQENKDQVSTIAELENKLIGAMAEIQVMGEVKQLPLFPPEPTPEPTPENIKSPAVESEPVNTEPDTTGTLTRGELVKYIHANFPGATITGQNIGDCYTLNKKGKLKSQRLPEFEATYGFSYLGKIGKENRFRLT